MKIASNGFHMIVRVTRKEVEAFKQKWPCSGLPDKAITFTFVNGDLVDVEPFNVDGPAAVALSQDAQRFAKERKGLDQLDY
jgi:hypothetical protein